MNQVDQVFTLFSGRHSSPWVLEMFSHPFLFIACIIIIGLGYLEFSRRIRTDEIQITNKSGRIIAIVGILLMMFIATR